MNAMLPSSLSTGRGEWRRRERGRGEEGGGGILNPGADAAAGGDRIDLKVPSNYGARVILNFSSTMWDF